MLKKMISGLCVISMVGCLMVGCSSTEELNDQEVKSQEEAKPQVEETKESELDKAYDIVMETIKENQEELGEEMETDDYRMEVIKDSDKLIVKITMKTITGEDILYLTNEEWNELLETDGIEMVHIIYDAFEELNIHGVKCVNDIYISDIDFLITRLDETGIIEDNFDKACAEVRERDTNKEGNNEEPEQQTNKNFYIGNDEMYHCSKCNNVPSKEEYNNGVCYSCEQHKDPVEQCYHCYAYIEPGHEYQINGLIYCEQCAIDMQEAELDETWICPDCGRVNKGEVLCDCEIEENY